MGYSYKRNKYYGKKRTTKDKETCSVAVGKVSYRRLDNKSEKTAYSYDETNLCQGKGIFLDKYRKKRVDKGRIKVTDKMNKGQAKYHLFISSFLIFHYNSK